MFRITSTKLRNAAMKSQATAQKLLAAAAAVQTKASEQYELAIAVEAKERVVELQLQAAAARLIFTQAGNTYANVIAERSVAEVTLAACKIKVEEADKALNIAATDFDTVNLTIEAAQTELAE